jgi:hypothetical protein
MIEDLSGKSGNAGNGYGLSSKSKVQKYIALPASPHECLCLRKRLKNDSLFPAQNIYFHGKRLLEFNCNL